MSGKGGSQWLLRSRRSRARCNRHGPDGRRRLEQPRSAPGFFGVFINGRAEIVAFLTRKWNKELDYRLIKELWAFSDNRIAVRFAYEWHDGRGNWFRSYGNENWEFDMAGVMQRRFASINDLPINEADREYHWPLGRRPDDHPSLSDLGL